MGANCKNCNINVGCYCNLTADLLCINCEPKQPIKQNTTIVNNNNGGINSIHNKKPKLGYQ